MTRWHLGARAMMLLAISAMAIQTGCLRLDFLVFDGEEIDEYELPDNDIPEANLEEVSFKSEEGDTIYGIWAWSDDVDRGDLTILYSHGNSQHIDRYWDRVMLKYHMGYTVFIYDYPGYGKSTGESTEAGVLASALGAHDHVVQTLADRNGGSANATVQDVIYYGWSLGSVPAIYMAADVEDPAALVTESALASGQALVDDSTEMGLPVSFFIDYELDNIGRIPGVTAPKLFSHGEVDDFIAFYFSDMLYDDSPDPREKWYSATANHGNVVCDGASDGCEGANDSDYEPWKTAFNDFVDRCVVLKINCGD